MAVETKNALFPKPRLKWPEAPLTIDDAHRLVGIFMWNWANLENFLNDAIRRTLRIEVLTMSMLGVHLSVDAKIHLLRCTVGLFSVPEEEWAKGAKKTLNAVKTMSEQRNILAHTGFGITSDNEAVSFFRVKATGALSVPEENWKPKDFSAEVMTMDALMDEVKQISDKIVERRSKVPMRGQTQVNYLQRLIQLGTEANPIPDGLLAAYAKKPAIKGTD